jgi:DNA-binding CsgD family transcriptional regulator
LKHFDQQRFEWAASRLSETVIDSGQWTNVMEDICEVVGATGAVLLQGDVRTPYVPRTRSTDDLVKAYFAGGFHLTDPRAERAVPLILAGGTFVAEQEIFTPEEIARSPFHNELLFPHGFSWWGVVGFWAGTSLWGLSFQLTAKEGPLENSRKRVLSRLSRRLTEVATLSKEVGYANLSSATSALDRVGRAAVAIDRRGFVLTANDLAEELFDDDLFVCDGRLIARDRQASRLLEELADRLRVTSDVAEFPTDPIVIRRNAKGAVVIHVLPVHGGARAPFLGARAILTLMPVAHRVAATPIVLARAFDLTAAEAKLAAIISLGKSPEQAAEELGIARTTARNQLRAIFAKTGVHRQSEFVALVSSL